MARKEQIFEYLKERNIPITSLEANSIIEGIMWADEHPNTEDIDMILAYTYRGLGWLAENIEVDMGTTGERALGCVGVLQRLCMDVITTKKEQQLQHLNIK